MDQQTPPTLKDVIEEMAVYLNSAEMTYEVIERTSNRIYRRTTRIIKAVFFSIGILLAINVYFIFHFGEGIVSMVSSMNQMYIHFGNMATQMHAITESMEKMANHIDVLPQMAENVNSMNHTVASMNANVHTMQGEVNLMSQDVGAINANMTDMTGRFNQVNGNMRNIGEDVKDISKVIPKIKAN